MKQRLFMHRFFPALLVFLLLPIAQEAQAQSYNARLEWLHKVELRLLDNGILQKVNVKLGQHVKKGAILARIDQREFNARIQKVQAELERAKLNLQNSNDELERTKELYERALIADQELNDAKRKYASIRAEIKSLNASLLLEKIALERTVLRAPISGIIVEKNTWEGDVIYKTLQKKPLISIAPNGSMLARALVNVSTLQKYKPGQTAKVNIRGKIYPGKIYSLGVEAVRIDPSGAVYELDIIFNHAANETLRPSQTVKVILP
jgi:RND family efflux transporter MFP subunit